MLCACSCRGTMPEVTRVGFAFWCTHEMAPDCMYTAFMARAHVSCNHWTLITLIPLRNSHTASATHAEQGTPTARTQLTAVQLSGLSVFTVGDGVYTQYSACSMYTELGSQTIDGASAFSASAFMTARPASL